LLQRLGSLQRFYSPHPPAGDHGGYPHYIGVVELFGVI